MEKVNFNELNLDENILRAIEEQGFEKMSAIQQKIIPFALSGADCLAIAPTGSGKTLAFGIPIVQKTSPELKRTDTLVLCPTRELAEQIATEFKKVSMYKEGVRISPIYGGQNFQRQLALLRKKPQIVIGTPGRIIDHIKRRTLDISAIANLILDEADEMLDMGFRDDIDNIISNIKERENTSVLLFSATMSREIKEISSGYQKNPIYVKIEGVEKPKVFQYYMMVTEKEKTSALQSILMKNDLNRALIFCNTRKRATILAKELNNYGLVAEVIHGELRQRERDGVMKKFRSGLINILVASDVAARGIDVEGIEAVFNYDAPFNAEYYLHRIGRTARAGKTGVAYTFFTDEDICLLNIFKELTDAPIDEIHIDGFGEHNKKKAIDKFKYVRLFLNIGAKDDIDENSLVDFIRYSTNIPLESIVEVKICDIFSFVEVEKEYKDKVMSLIGRKVKKRTLNIEESSVKKNDNKTKKGNLRKSFSDKKADYKKEDKKPSKKIENQQSEFKKKGKKFDEQKPDLKKKGKRFDDKKPEFGNKDRKKSNGRKEKFDKKTKKGLVRQGEKTNENFRSKRVWNRNSHKNRA